MPTISEAVGWDTSLYSPTGSPQPQPVSVAPGSSGGSAFRRCPLPAILTQSPDSLKQYYRGGLVPQYRFLSPISFQVSNTSSTTTVSTTSSGSGGSTSNKVMLAAITTATLSPGASIQTSVQIAVAFQLLGVTANTACRIELYGTKTAQSLDSMRAIDTPPPAGTTQNIVSDLVLDTVPYMWGFQNRVGSNGDNPQGKTIYATITNLSSSSIVITATITYLPFIS